MKLDCREAVLRIQPYLDRSLEDRECKEFLRHIMHCKSCRDELETAFLVEHALEYLDESDRDSFDIRSLLNEDITKVERQIVMHRISEVLIWIAVVLMTATIFIITLRFFAPHILNIVGDKILKFFGIDTDYTLFELIRLRITGSI
ncbi:MAG: zf-HC2 domain-containing protein [Lachnospiraceae bacterium]|nr:zf-HC2 domain-containing protein [Lachnospiraceae bacterium]